MQKTARLEHAGGGACDNRAALLLNFAVCSVADQWGSVARNLILSQSQLGHNPIPITRVENYAALQHCLFLGHSFRCDVKSRAVKKSVRCKNQRALG